MKIHAYIIAYNEEKLLPFTLDSYSIFCEKIFVYDKYSTDSSDKIYKKGYSISAHNCQGLTITTNIFISLNNLFTENLLYVMLNL